MTIVQTVATVSHRYYQKRNRSVAELNVRQMCRALGKPCPDDLGTMEKSKLVNLAMSLHRELPQ